MRKAANLQSGSAVRESYGEVARKERLPSHEREPPELCGKATLRRGTKSLPRKSPWKRALVLAEAHGRRSPSGGGRSYGAGAGLARLVG